MPTFPTLPDALMRARLEPPSGRVRVVIDSDTHNEIDDQYTIAWALLSQDVLEIEGTTAAPYSFAHYREPLLAATELVERGGDAPGGEAVAEIDRPMAWARDLIAAGIDPRSIEFVGPDEGVELSYREAVKVYELLDEDPAGVHRGSPGYLPSLEEPYDNDAVRHIIDRALADDERPLYIAAIGALTNIASAILIEPRIIERIVVIWTSGYPSWSPLSNTPSLNLVQDPHSSRLLFDCGVPHVYLPGFYIGAQLSVSLPEVERWVRGRGRIGDYLHELYANNPLHAQRGVSGQFGRTWVMWDLIAIAWLLRPAWVPSLLTTSPTLDDDLVWQRTPGRHAMREAIGIERDEIYRDLFRKLEGAP